MEHPKVTVISVVLNAARAFETTALSILEQDYPGLEWIVIDGGSTDGTVDVIRRLEPGIAFWSSEPDKGIYDGMNKGLKRATGEWVNFMNAGDSFASHDTISRIFAADMTDTDVVYGDCIIRYHQVSRYKTAGRPEDLMKGMAFCHQAVFTRTIMFDDAGFNTRYRIAADYHHLISLWKSGKRFKHLAIPVTLFDNGGVSNNNMYQSAREHFEIVKSSFPVSPLVWLHHQVFLAWVGSLTIAYRILPDRFIQFVRSLMARIFNRTN